MQRNNGKLNVLGMYFRRIIRIVPLVCFTVLIVMSLLKYFGSGPNWPYYLRLARYPCEENWWKTVLFAQNYGSDYVVSIWLNDWVCYG